MIHLRALALQNPSNAPVAKQSVTFEVEDAKGNKLMKQGKKSDGYGIAAVDFRLASIVNIGTFKVRALLGKATGEKTVEVSRYVLPKFDVKISANKAWYAAAQKVKGTIDARYFFGKQVNGAHVLLEALTLDVGQNVFQQVMGMTDANGRMSFSITLPQALAGIPLQDGNALVTLRATVTDTAQQEVVKELAVTVAQNPVRLSLVPEATTLVPGVENRLHLFATDPLGAPLRDAEVEISRGHRDVERENRCLRSHRAALDAGRQRCIGPRRGHEQRWRQGRAGLLVRQSARRRARARAHGQVRVRGRRQRESSGDRLEP